MKTQALSRYPSWRQICRPCTLRIVGLAIAVFLWGFGYKLSLYHIHANPTSRVTVAKLWVKPGTASMVAAARFKAKSHLDPGSQALSIFIQRLPRFRNALACIPYACSRVAAHFDFLIPFRSPPPHRFALA
jgi:hypothetical protein